MGSMNNLFYWGILFPISKLPYRVLLSLRPLLYFLIATLFAYRKRVIMNNLRLSFPMDSEELLHQKKNTFYWHLCTVLLESIKNLSFSAHELRERVVFRNPELVVELQQSKRNVILVGGHYGNWEWIITALGLHFPKNLFGLGMPLSATFWDKKLTERRERFGLTVIHSKNYRTRLLQQQNQPFLLLMLADQSPGDSSKSYWMNFLHQQTAVAFGSEFLANETNACVVSFEMLQKEKGKYEVVFELVTKEPQSLPFGAITESFTQKLEGSIKKAPYLWMWSHKRWKREVPQDLSALREKQEQQFNSRFRQ